MGRVPGQDPSEDRNVTARECFEDLLGRFHVVRVVYHVHGDLRVPDCASPLGGNPQLDFGLDMPRPIDDLEVSDDGIRATLSFSCEPVPVFVPWAAVNTMGGIYARPQQKAQLKAI
jgi:hypothetical protein